MIFAGISRAIIFSKIVMANCRTEQSLQRAFQALAADPHQPFTNEADNFFPQSIAGTGPNSRAAQMLHKRLQRAELQIVNTGLDQGIKTFFEKIEKGELVTAAGLMRDIDQRNRDRRRSRCEVGNDLLVTDRFQDVLDRFLKLFECNNVLVVSKVQIKCDALGDMLGQPPARVTGLIGRAVNRGVQPVAVELEELA